MSYYVAIDTGPVLCEYVPFIHYFPPRDMK